MEMDFDDFVKDKKTIYAVVRVVEIIGEATKNIPNTIRKIFRSSLEKGGRYER